MRRKLVLVEAIAPAPDLLLLDEPTVGLDPAGSAALREAIRETTLRGTAVVVASNETKDLPLWGSRIVFLHRGTIVEDANVANLLSRLGTGTRIEIGVEGEVERDGLLSRLYGLSGVEHASVTTSRVDIRSSVGGRLLPPLLAALLDEGLAVLDVRVRGPELADLFLDLTGERLPAVTDSVLAPRRAGEDAAGVRTTQRTEPS
jgi:ABC-2 type transport system ATP-binding protein